MTPTPALAIRRADAADAELLADLAARTFSEAFAADNNPDDMAAYIAAAFSHAQLTAELADSASTFFVADVGGRAAGYAKLHVGAPPEGVRGPRPVELVRLYVSREWLGRGVGEALMRVCIGEARRAGRATMWLGVWEGNARAQAFYRRWNFRPVGEHVFHLGADAQRDILMQRAL